MKKILIADSDAEVRRMFKDVLQGLDDNNFVFYEACDGLEAVESYNINRPDLVLMDIIMPNMDGLTALKEIKKKAPTSTVIMITASGQEVLLIDALKEGARDFIMKPLKSEQITKALYNFID